MANARDDRSVISWLVGGLRLNLFRGTERGTRDGGGSGGASKLSQGHITFYA